MVSPRGSPEGGGTPGNPEPQNRHRTKPMTTDPNPDRARTCPNCGALQGAPCRRLDGAEMPNLVHPSRNPRPPTTRPRRRRSQPTTPANADTETP